MRRFFTQPYNMKRFYALAAAALMATATLNAQVPETPDSVSVSVDSLLTAWSQIDSSFHWQYGKIELGQGMASLEVPQGFKFLNAEESGYVLSDLWGNPPDESIVGMLFREQDSPMLGNLYAITLSFEEEGYVEDDDAQDLDYDELLEQLQEDTRLGNESRQELGYGTVELLGWATPPYYDAEAKKLHWAKVLHFQDEEEPTLNYNIRVLGRKGYMVLNAISSMSALDSVNADLAPILASVNFNEGHRYSDFDPEIDKVAAYGIGGLIAGKILAKAGFFAFIAKFGKFIVMGVIGLFAVLRKRIFGGGNA